MKRKAFPSCLFDLMKARGWGYNSHRWQCTSCALGTAHEPMYITSLNFLTTLYCLSFLGKETGLERKSKLIFKVSVLGNGRSDIQTHCHESTDRAWTLYH